MPEPLIGQAFTHGPVILAWDAVKTGALDPRDGRNVVYHEFAHQLDMRSGAADGVPPQQSWHDYREFIRVFTAEYERLRQRVRHHRPALLDPYALKNGAEFFAVATEHFFEQPLLMERDHAEMYGVLRHFYRQHPAERLRNHLAAKH